MVPRRRLAVRLRPVDQVILAYLAVASAVAAARLPTIHSCAWVLAANGLIVLLITLVNRPGLGQVGRALTELYPLLVVVGLYGALDLLSGFGAARTHDWEVQRWEAAIFGGQVSREWWQRSPSTLWSTVLHGAYLSYYLIVPAGPLWFLGAGRTRELHRTMLMIVSSFLLCYLVFIFYPVAGPYYEFPPPTTGFLDNPAARLVYRILARGSAYGAAFPSSHVAATVAATIAVTAGAPRLGLALAVPTILLTIGVVYCQMHYAVDVLAGLIVAGIAVCGVLLAEKRRPSAAARP
jgi:membrane-associated phospholipid phosphatase